MASKIPYYTRSEPEGNVIVDLAKLKEAMELMHKCKSGRVFVVDSYEKRHGLSNSLYFECSYCKHRVYLETSQKTGGVSDTNRRAAYAMSEIGLGREDLSTICEVMKLSQSVSDSNFQEHNEAIHNAIIEVVDSKLKEAGPELREKMLKENPNLFKDSVLDITVSFDGTWSKRGFTANYGIGFVIAAETVKVLDVITLSKTCEICKQRNKLKNYSTKYQQWKNNHENSGKCQKKNFRFKPNHGERSCKDFVGVISRETWLSIYFCGL